VSLPGCGGAKEGHSTGWAVLCEEVTAPSMCACVCFTAAVAWAAGNNLLVYTTLLTGVLDSSSTCSSSSVLPLLVAAAAIMCTVTVCFCSDFPVFLQ
jgi:hypothetical protein